MTPVSKIHLITACAAFALLAGIARAADAPVQTQWGLVSEPAMPTHVCATLKATLTSDHGSLDAVDAQGKTTHPDQERLQMAIDACHDGAVKLVAGEHGEDGFLTSPIQLRTGVILWIDNGVTLFASRDPKDYDNGPGDCGTANRVGKKSCTSLIWTKNADHAGIVGAGRIDGRGGSLLLSGPNAGKRSWWDVAWQTKQGLIQHNFRLLQIDGGKDFILHGVTFENSPNFHIVSNGLSGFTAWGIRILSPSMVYTKPGYACPEGSTPDTVTPATCFTPETVKNTDGFDPGQSDHVLLAYSYISTGDDNVAIKAHGDAPASLITIAHNHFYYGHGMSLGSETDSGDHDIHVYDLSLDGMDSAQNNGLRIKSDASRGGKVTNVVFEDICMRGQLNPIVLDTAYAKKSGTDFPDFADITLRNVHDLGSVKFKDKQRIVLRGFDDQGQHLPLGVRFDNVVFDQTPLVIGNHNPKDGPDPLATHVIFGPGPVSFAGLIKPSTDRDVTVDDQRTGDAAPRDCSAAFPKLSDVLADSPI
ncbi:glycosyl hydrolase family 28 protein [Asticcacaulis sp. EMRT-3]|uniref:glycoside hydrolase family 28 protein n=1 Tax=Asticcacaulis sp. EMRT-3 TaxID=3040349 RepID=UPI0024AE9FE4|nr:glycosyl hydrolase family 28 protein [Asticcacaulis sp. EMRT-3]MDI7776488.1 glycosyl hydrolase family 28 protein [Asticcacaulis sp. EMRT-3]